MKEMINHVNKYIITHISYEGKPEVSSYCAVAEKLSSQFMCNSDLYSKCKLSKPCCQARLTEREADGLGFGACPNKHIGNGKRIFR